MSWPLSQDYNESIQDPRNSFSDAELKTGEAVANPLGIPLPRSGNFADVYEVRCPSGSRWAVKCFTREVAGLRERYHEISKYLHQTNLPFMVDFQYLEQGIRVRGGWYPILKMQWVEGFVLNEFVRDNLDKKPILQAMGQIWLRMARRLRDAKLAHCDLQHGNVLLVPGSTANSLAVKLIDYDGMCVPALLGKKSGEVGHPAFQHPERLRTGAYNQEVDRFSLLAIAAGLRCLTVGGRSLWERYDNGDNLLFRHADLQAPADSPLFQELLEIPDPQAQALVKELFRACRGPLDKVPLLTDLIPEEKPASKGTTKLSAKQAAGAQGADWDFNENESAPSVVKKPRASSKTPKWIWAAAAGVAAVLLLGVGVGAGLMMRNGPAKNEGTSVAQKTPETKKSNPAPKPPPLDVKPTPKPVTPPPDPVKPAAEIVNPPPTPNPRGMSPTLTWEKPENPDGDCDFKNVGGKLTIQVPGKDHDLDPDRGRANAPRVLSLVEGDFTIQVRVSGEFQPSAESTAQGRASYLGAGLVMWINDKTFIRLERAVMMQQNNKRYRFNWTAFSDGKRQETGGIGPSPVGEEMYLKIQRRGEDILGSFSLNGQGWSILPPFKGNQLSAKVKIGLLAISTSTQPFAPVFDQLRFRTGTGQLAQANLPLAPAMDSVVNPPAGASNIAWDKPINPDGDCTFKNAGGKLMIAVPDKPHVLETATNRANSPRVLTDIEGDFTVQVRVGGDFVPAETASRKPDSWVGAGLLLWVNEGTFLRLERAGVFGRNPSTLYASWEVRQDGEGKDVKHNFPTLRGTETDLRLERRSNTILAAFKEDGQWHNVKPLEINLPPKVKIGLVAGSTTARPFAPIFDQFQLKNGQGQLLRANLPMAPTTEPVAGKRRSPRRPVPEEMAIKAALKDLRRAYKKEFDSRDPADREQLRTVLKKEVETAADDPPRLFAALRALRDVEAERNVVQGLYEARRLADTFAISPLEAQYGALEVAGRKGKQGMQAMVLELLLPLLPRALAEKEYPLARQLTKFTRDMAAKVSEPALKVEAQALAAHTDTVVQEHDIIRADEVSLEVNADDAKANLAVGKFHCAYRDDWEEGLPLLARGGDAALKKLAEQDLADSGDAAERVRLGDAWRDQAGKSMGPLKDACRRRAYHWYQSALLDQPAGKNRTEVEQQVVALGKALPELHNPCPNLGVHNRYLKRDALAGYVRLMPSPIKVATRQSYRGPIEVAMVLRAAKNNFRLELGQGGDLQLTPVNEGNRLLLHRPDSYLGGPLYGTQPNNKVIALPSKQWYTLRWRITAAGMKLWIDNDVVFEETFALDLTERHPVQIALYNDPIEIKTLVVNRVRGK